MTMSTAKLVPQPSVVDLRRRFAKLLNAKFQNRFDVPKVYIRGGVRANEGSRHRGMEMVRDLARANCIPAITVADIILISFS